MPIFQLVLQTSPESAPETLQFIAADMPSALTFANQHTSTLPAELWEAGVRVCRLVYSEQEGSWLVTEQGARVAAS